MARKRCTIQYNSRHTVTEPFRIKGIQTVALNYTETKTFLPTFGEIEGHAYLKRKLGVSRDVILVVFVATICTLYRSKRCATSG
jgi:hypothetical protein